MKHEKVITAFINKETALDAKTRTNGKTICSYFTRIAEWKDSNTIIANMSKYSVSTTALQNAIVAEAEKIGIKVIVVKGVPQNYDDPLGKFVTED